LMGCSQNTATMRSCQGACRAGSIRKASARVLVAPTRIATLCGRCGRHRLVRDSNGRGGRIDEKGNRPPIGCMAWAQAVAGGRGAAPPTVAPHGCWPSKAPILQAHCAEVPAFKPTLPGGGGFLRFPE
jgi:hypothetical protein